MHIRNNYRMSTRTEKVVFFGIYICLAMIFSYVEAVIPIPMVIPGFKLGLANIVVLLAWETYGFSCAVLTDIIRIFITGYMFGSAVSLIFSLSGGLLSLLMMCFIKKLRIFSIYGVSITGGVFHNAGQLIAAGCVFKTAGFIYLLPAYTIAGVATGLVIGILSDIIIKRTSVYMSGVKGGNE